MSAEPRQARPARSGVPARGAEPPARAARWPPQRPRPTARGRRARRRRARADRRDGMTLGPAHQGKAADQGTVGSSMLSSRVRVRRGEPRQPAVGVGTELRDEPAHSLDLAGPARNHRELRVEALEIEPADRAMAALLDEEHPRAGIELLFEKLHLALREAEARDVLLLARLGIGEEDLRRRLLDERAADGARQHIARALRREAHDAVQLPPGFGAIFRETLER